MEFSQPQWLNISKVVHKNAGMNFALTDYPQAIQDIFANIKSSTMASLNANEAYGRHVLFSTPDFEVMLASWRPFASCAPHDHGFSTGTVLVVEGQFEELSYKWSSDSGDIKADLQSLRRASKGQFLEVEGDTFHSMKNVGQTGITLHFYTPAISNMKVLDLRNKQTLTVSEDCGAWIPTDLHKIKGIQKWQKTQIG